MNRRSSPLYLLSAQLERNEHWQFNEYPFNIPAFAQLKELNFNAPVTFFIGENGSGKSTLLEAIAHKFRLGPEGGSHHHWFETAQTLSPLHNSLRVVRSGARMMNSYFLRAETMYNVATYIDNAQERGSRSPLSLHANSHGEAFLRVLTERLEGGGLYLMDEPEAALSPMRQLSLLAIIDRLVKRESQLVIATHSPILMAFPGAEIFHFSEAGIHQIEYEETEHFRVTKEFLQSPSRMLKYLLEDDDVNEEGH